MAANEKKEGGRKVTNCRQTLDTQKPPALFYHRHHSSGIHRKAAFTPPITQGLRRWGVGGESMFLKLPKLTVDEILISEIFQKKESTWEDVPMHTSIAIN